MKKNAYLFIMLLFVGIQVAQATDIKNIRIGIGGPPLIILDGVEIDTATINLINAGDIESVTVLRGCTALPKYGERATNGVIVIITKQEKNSLDTSQLPIFILDGVITEPETILLLDPNDFLSISVIEDDSFSIRHTRPRSVIPIHDEGGALGVVVVRHRDETKDIIDAIKNAFLRE